MVLAETCMTTVQKMGRILAPLAEKERMYGTDWELWDDFFMY